MMMYFVYHHGTFQSWDCDDDDLDSILKDVVDTGYAVNQVAPSIVYGKTKKYGMLCLLGYNLVVQVRDPWPTFYLNVLVPIIQSRALDSIAVDIGESLDSQP
jgi:hypothetical protein